ncbi:MAG: hypothetical protein M0T70_15640 [Geobacteraceae bacterium]|nr:hypothetical protein [Geobacteraceae bacterium]
MKIYGFDTETGLYLGQDFGDRTDISVGNGITELAPPDCNRGETPVFDFNTHQWVVVENDKVQPMLIQNRKQTQK